MSPFLFLYVALGGALGAVLRFGVANVIGRFFPGDFNYAILTINIVGSVLMGVLVGYSVQRSPVSLELRTFLAVGVLGGFTTFSSFALDIVSMMQKGNTVPAMIYLVASVTLSVVGLSLGMMLMRPHG